MATTAVFAGDALGRDKVDGLPATFPLNLFERRPPGALIFLTVLDVADGVGGRAVGGVGSEEDTLGDLFFRSEVEGGDACVMGFGLRMSLDDALGISSKSSSKSSLSSESDMNVARFSCSRRAERVSGAKAAVDRYCG